jgi:hypothetical protein
MASGPRTRAPGDAVADEPPDRALTARRLRLGDGRSLDDGLDDLGHLRDELVEVVDSSVDGVHVAPLS